MSENHQFNEDKSQLNADKRRSGLDLFGSLGNSSGLTPLSFDADVTTERTENTEILKNSSGLSPLRPFGEIHKKNMKSDYSGEGLSTSDGTDILGNSSGLTTLHSGSENFKRRVIE
jgi:hypothetical protein